MTEKMLINDNKSNNFEIKSNNEINREINEMVRIIDDNHGFIVSSVETAKALYEQGYRKQNEGEWIITPPVVMRVWDSDCITCSVCGGKSVGLVEDIRLKYCPHCGARMLKDGD